MNTPDDLCPACNGDGQRNTCGDECARCNGTGRLIGAQYLSREELLEVISRQDAELRVYRRREREERARVARIQARWAREAA